MFIWGLSLGQWIWGLALLYMVGRLIYAMFFETRAIQHDVLGWFIAVLFVFAAGFALGII